MAIFDPLGAFGESQSGGRPAGGGVFDPLGALGGSTQTSQPFDPLRAFDSPEMEEERRRRKLAQMELAQQIGDAQWQAISGEYGNLPDDFGGAAMQALLETFLGIPATALNSAVDLSSGALSALENAGTIAQLAIPSALNPEFTNPLSGEEQRLVPADALNQIGSSIAAPFRGAVEHQAESEIGQQARAAEAAARDGGGFAGNLALDVVRQAPQLAVAATAGPAALPLLSASATGSGIESDVAGGMAAEEAAARAGNLVSGLWEGITENLPFGSIKRLRGLLEPGAAVVVGDALKNVAKSFGQEATEETVNAIGNFILDEFDRNAGKPLTLERAADAAADVLYQGLVGGLAGGKSALALRGGLPSRGAIREAILSKGFDDAFREAAEGRLQAGAPALAETQGEAILSKLAGVRTAQGDTAAAKGAHADATAAAQSQAQAAQEARQREIFPAAVPGAPSPQVEAEMTRRAANREAEEAEGAARAAFPLAPERAISRPRREAPPAIEVPAAAEVPADLQRDIEVHGKAAKNAPAPSALVEPERAPDDRYPTLDRLRQILNNSALDDETKKRELQALEDLVVRPAERLGVSPDDYLRDVAKLVRPEVDVESVDESHDAATLNRIKEAADAGEVSGKTYQNAEEFFGEVWPSLLRKAGKLGAAFKGKRINRRALTREAKRAAQEVAAWMEKNPEFADYYHNDMERSRAAAAREFPEIATDDGAWKTMRLLMGVSSANTDLSLNTAEAVEAYRAIRSAGETGVRMGGKRGRSISAESGGFSPFTVQGGGASANKAFNYRIVDALLSKFRGDGAKLVEFLSEPVDVKSFQAFRQEMGLGKAGDIATIKENVRHATGQSDRVPRMFIFGPKVGAYALNLQGDDRFTTTDVWEGRFARSFFKDMHGEGKDGLPAGALENDLMTAFGHGVSAELGLAPAAGQAARWFYTISQMKRAGYSKAKTSETISTYLENAILGRKAPTQSSRQENDRQQRMFAAPPAREPRAPVVSIEAEPGEGAPRAADFAAARNELGAKSEVFERDLMRAAANGVAMILGIKSDQIGDAVFGAGGWEGFAGNLSLQQGVPAKKASLFADAVGYVLEQTAVWAVTPTNEVAGSREAVEIVSDLFRDRAVWQSFWDDVRAQAPEAKGYAPIRTPEGTLGFRVILTSSATSGARGVPVFSDTLSSVFAAAKRAGESLGAGAVTVTPTLVKVDERSNDWKENPNGEGYLAPLQAALTDRKLEDLDTLRGSLGRRVALAARPDAARDRRDREGAPREHRRWKRARDGFVYRVRQRDAVALRGKHYSNTAGLDALDGWKYGSKNPGAEWRRVEGAPAELRARVYFYPEGTELSERGETGVGRAAVYDLSLANLYDTSVDPRGLWKNRTGGNQFEQALIDAGYDGYVVRDLQMGVLLGTAPVPVDNAQEPDTLNRDAEASITFDKETGDALIRLARDRSGEALAEELAHLHRRKALPPALRQRAEKLLRVDRAGWTREKEEAYAKKVLLYLRRLHQQPGVFKDIANHFRDWLADVRQFVTGRVREDELGRGFRKFMEENLGTRDRRPEAISTGAAARTGPRGLLRSAADPASGEQLVADVTKRGVLRRWVTAQGGLTDEGMRLFEDKNSEIAAAINAAFDLANALRRGITEQAKKTGVEEAELNRLAREFISGEAIVTNQDGVEREVSLLDSERTKRLMELPPELRALAKRMRIQVDKLSNKLADSGMLTQAMEQIFGANLTRYLRRTYQAHRDDKYLKKIRGTQFWNDLRPEIEQMLRDMAAEKGISSERREKLLRMADDVDAFMADQIKKPPEHTKVLGTGTGTADVGIFKPREDIPLPIKKLLGQDFDAATNYLQSVMAMSRNLATFNMYQGMVSAGLRDGWVSDIPKEGFTRVPGADTRNPIGHDFWVRDDVHEAIVGSQMTLDNSLYRLASGAVKMGLTVLSPQTHARNTVSNVLLLTASGNWAGARHLFGSLQASRHQGSGERSAALSQALGFESMSDEEILGTYQKLLRLGVVATNVDVETIRSFLNTGEILWEPPAEGAGKRAKQLVRSGLRNAQRAYQIEDDIFKMSAFLAERARYKKILPDAGAAELDRIAADNTKNILPNYNRISKIMQLLRDNPVLAPFVAFNAEVPRNVFHILRLAGKEISMGLAGNGAALASGINRVVSLNASVFGAHVAASSIVSLVFGAIGDDDRERELKALVPWFMRNAQPIFMPGQKDGEFLVFDFGFMDPFAMIKRPFFAATSKIDAGMAERFLDGFKELAGVYLGEEILAGLVMDIMRGETESGRPLFPKDSATGAVIETVGELGRLMPGFTKTASRIVMGLAGTSTLSGRVYDWRTELLAVGGPRVYKFNVSQALEDAAKNYRFSLSDAQSEERVGKKMANSPAYIRWRARFYLSSAETQNRKAGERLYLAVQAARSRGLTEVQVRQILRDARVPADDIRGALSSLEEAQDAAVARKRRN